MALQHSLRRLAPLARTRPAALPRRGLASAAGAGERTPPCREEQPPPCVPAPQPPCRARPPAVRRALRVVCCAPPAGARPPCATPDPPCALTCRDAPAQDPTASSRAPDGECPAAHQSCGSETDRVARRLSRAALLRRRDYEREAARRAAAERAPSPAPPVADYRLGGERECARATDGCLYTIPRPSAPRPRCGPDREPPPPRCVELAPDDACRIRHEERLDPCAHRPRVMVEIDRSADDGGGVSRAGPARRDAKKIPQSPSEGLTSRIMKTLNLGGGKGSGGAASVPRKPCGASCEAGVAKRAGDRDWCATLPPPEPTPPRCRRPTIADRLRSRKQRPDCGRGLHTSAPASGSTTAPEGLKETLRRRSDFNEAGLGRVVTAATPQRQRSPGGWLELCVPPGTDLVQVSVSLEKIRGGPCAEARAPARPGCGAAAAPAGGGPRAPASGAALRPTDPCRRAAGTGERKDSWLSIKNIQKKLSGGRSESERGAAPRAPARPVCPAPDPAPPRNPAPRAPCPCRPGTEAAQKPKRCSSLVIVPDATPLSF